MSILYPLLPFLFARVKIKKITDKSFAGYFLVSSCIIYDLIPLLSDCKLNNANRSF